MTARLRLSELEAISFARALTAAESEELFRVHAAEDLRQRRLPERIMRLRAELHRAEAELWVRYIPVLRRLEEVAVASTIAELEREMAP